MRGDVATVRAGASGDASSVTKEDDDDDDDAFLRFLEDSMDCLLYTSPSPRDRTRSRMPSSA